MLIAHAKVYRLFKQYYQRNSPDSKIGIVNTCWNFYPVNPSQPESSDIAYEYNCGWLSNPIFSLDGDYPTVMKERIEKNSLLKGLKQSELPKLSEQLIERIKLVFLFSIFIFFCVIFLLMNKNKFLSVEILRTISD